jgi:2-keto-4-pentenoate hydratase/2-oxohepta-3-ene-1,7-dioic acid hydratase in catechol pathway
MRIITYRSNPQEPWQAGIEQNGQVIAATAVHSYDQHPHTVRALIEAGPEALAKALANARDVFQAANQPLLSLESLELHAPIPDPEKIICLGVNYADHAAESNMSLPAYPVLFPKYRNSLTGPFSPIVLPRFSEQIDYEGELAVIIGQTCKDVSEQDALQYVAGYSILDDVSARDWQFLSSQWMAGKAIDTFAPMGPGIVPASEIPDPQALRITTRVNGETLQDSNTRHMIFTIAKSIEFISTFMTLVPGDIISTGTPSGVGFSRKPPIFLRQGDVVDVEIEGVGLISNKVLNAPAR